MSKYKIPIILIVAEYALAFMAAYLIIMLIINIHYISIGESGIRKIIINLFHLAWSITAIVGIQFKYRTAWLIARTVSAIIGVLGIFGIVIIIIILITSNIFNNDIISAIRYIIYVSYILILYFLLSGKEALLYFNKASDPKTMSNGK
jgi:hypothetical protein